MEYYKVFYTDRGILVDAQPDLSLLVPLNFASKDEALNKAFKLIYSGAIVWRIEGADGFYLDHAEIKRLYWKFKAA
jgi:hypothetical protein